MKVKKKNELSFNKKTVTELTKGKMIEVRGGVADKDPGYSTYFFSTPLCFLYTTYSTNPCLE